MSASIGLTLSQAFSNRLFFRFVLSPIHHRDPSSGTSNRPVAKQLARLVAAVNPTPQTSVFPIFCSLTQIRSQGISFNISQYRQQMFVFFNWKSLEPSLIKVSCSFGMMVSMPTHRVRVRQPSKKLSHLCVGGGPNNEMPMVRHQDVRKNGKGNAIMGQSQYTLKCFVVILLLKKWQPSNCSVDNVEASSSRTNSWTSWHARNLTDKPAQNNELRPLFFYSAGLKIETHVDVETCVPVTIVAR